MGPSRGRDRGHERGPEPDVVVHPCTYVHNSAWRPENLLAVSLAGLRKTINDTRPKGPPPGSRGPDGNHIASESTVFIPHRRHDFLAWLPALVQEDPQRGRLTCNMATVKISPQSVHAPACSSGSGSQSFMFILLFKESTRTPTRKMRLRRCGTPWSPVFSTPSWTTCAESKFRHWR